MNPSKNGNIINVKMLTDEGMRGNLLTTSATKIKTTPLVTLGHILLDEFPLNFRPVQ